MKQKMKHNFKILLRIMGTLSFTIICIVMIGCGKKKKDPKPKIKPKANGNDLEQILAKLHKDANGFNPTNLADKSGNDLMTALLLQRFVEWKSACHEPWCDEKFIYEVIKLGRQMMPQIKSLPPDVQSKILVNFAKSFKESGTSSLPPNALQQLMQGMNQADQVLGTNSSQILQGQNNGLSTQANRDFPAPVSSNVSGSTTPSQSYVYDEKTNQNYGAVPKSQDILRLPTSRAVNPNNKPIIRFK